MLKKVVLISLAVLVVAACDDNTPSTDPEYGTGGYHIYERTPSGMPDIDIHHVQSYKIENGMIVFEKNGIRHFVNMTAGDVQFTKER